MSGLHRGAAIGWQLIASRLAVPAQHGALPSLSSTVLSGSSSWSVELAAQAGLAGWHRVTTLVSSLADARLLAVPKRKASHATLLRIPCRRPSHCVHVHCTNVATLRGQAARPWPWPPSQPPPPCEGFTCMAPNHHSRCTLAACRSPPTARANAAPPRASGSSPLCPNAASARKCSRLTRCRPSARRTAARRSTLERGLPPPSTNSPMISETHVICYQRLLVPFNS